ncbi:hypothetical protein GLYMA_02G125551v4 [Glycine max]|nr:hypothetical protein GLYMA_02G125551v4 [Glycine max]KAH1060027.1 hypothetical protein GYH30_003823 [Glycine max]
MIIKYSLFLFLFVIKYPYPLHLSCIFFLLVNDDKCDPSSLRDFHHCKVWE